MKIDLFQSYGYCWAFQICWLIECNTLTATSFRIWNKSAAIPSPPLNLLLLVLTISVLYHTHLWIKCSLDISNFLEKFSGIFHSFLFLYFFALFNEEGLISSYHSLELCIQLRISFPRFLLLLFPQLYVKPPQTTILPFCVSFSLIWFWPLTPV